MTRDQIKADDDDMGALWREHTAVRQAKRADTSGERALGEIQKLPIDYLQSFRDGLEWAADLVEAEDPRTSDWMYDDRNDLAEAIRRGPEMPPAQPAQAQPAQAQPARLSDERIDAILQDAGIDEYAAIPIEYDRQVARAIEAAVVPQGFVVVPVKPTAKMLANLMRSSWDVTHGDIELTDNEVLGLYRAMIAAAKATK